MTHESRKVIRKPPSDDHACRLGEGAQRVLAQEFGRPHFASADFTAHLEVEARAVWVPARSV